MVALSGRGWQLAPCLITMVDEANRIAPKRNRAADGSIGDQAHANRTSDHNPQDGWVCAVDLTHAPASGFDAHARARMVVARRDHRIKYVISNGQIARGYDKPGIPAWTWTTYTGSNQHISHAHFSGNNTAAARNDRSSWWPATSNPTTTPAPTEDYDDMHAGEIIASYVEAYGNPTKQQGKDIRAWIHAVYAKPTKAERDGGVAYIRKQLGLS